jgi:hypothetical protein
VEAVDLQLRPTSPLAVMAAAAEAAPAQGRQLAAQEPQALVAVAAGEAQMLLVETAARVLSLSQQARSFAWP